jgi:hypothetical protein
LRTKLGAGNDMELQAVHAIYENGRLIFTDPNTAPINGSEVLVTYFVRASKKTLENNDPILKLRGRGKGEHLVEKLLKSRHKDRNHYERQS